MTNKRLSAGARLSTMTALFRVPFKNLSCLAAIALLSVATLVSNNAAAQVAGADDPLSGGVPSDSPLSESGGSADLGPELSGYKPHMLGVELGMRNLAIINDGYQLYRPSGWLGQLSLTVNVLPFHFGQFSVGVTGEYAVGSASDSVRGLPSSVTLQRIVAGVQAQYVVAERLRFYGRVTPGAWYADASLEDAAFDAPLAADGWTWAVDTTAGVALRLGSAGGQEHDPWVRFWLMGEAGYGFAGNVDMSFRPQLDEEDAAVDYGEVILPGLNPSGFTSRLAVGLSF